MMASDILIVSAVQFEAQETLTLLSDKKIPFSYFAFGIGAIAAAKSHETLQKLSAAKDVIFMGSCGTFGVFQEPFLVTTDLVAWSPIGERVGISYGLEAYHPELSIPLAKRRFFKDLPQHNILCAPSISTQDDLPVKWRDKREHLSENLELYSVLPAILAHAKSVSIILGVTNKIGAQAHEQWKAYFNLVAKMSAVKIIEELS